MKREKIILFTKYFAIFLWLSLLIETDSYYSIYLMLGVLSIVSITKNKNQGKKSSHSKLSYLFAGLFSLATTLANYSLFSRMAESGGLHIVTAILASVLTFASGIIVFKNVLLVTRNFSIKTSKKLTDSPRKVFLICFLIFSLIDLLVLFLCCYPGSLTPDSIDEIGQILSGSYSNHHPFYYTILIYPFIQLGTNVFHDINIGVAFFNVFQILILSAAFAYSISTLFHIGVSKKVLFILTVVLAILPYNIIFSFTVWKDVMFAALFLIFIVTLYRYFYDLRLFEKSKIPQLTLLFFSGLTVCLLRSNALIAIVVSIIIFFIIFRKHYVKLGIILIVIIASAFILKRPVLSLIGVTQTDTIESLSIPSQQIARTIKYKYNKISEEDINLINNLADSKELAEAYTPTISDPVKNTVRKYNNQKYIKEHAVDLIMLYLKLGTQHPVQYLTAWIEQTKGYWNGGYMSSVWANEVQDNNYGLKRSGNTFMNKLFGGYLEIYRSTTFLQSFISIGLLVWLLFILLYRSVIDKNKINLFLITPILTTWATLLIATPVYSELRYIYFAFTTIPFLIIITFTRPPKQLSLTNEKKPNEKR